MKKLLVLSIATMLVLAGCTSTKDPATVYTDGVSARTSDAQNFDFKVSSVITTVEGDIATDAFGTVNHDALEPFNGTATATVLMGKEGYKSLELALTEGAAYVQMDETKSKTTLEAVLTDYSMVDLTKLHTLIPASSENAEVNETVYVFTAKDADAIKAVLDLTQTVGLSELKLVSGTVTTTVTFEKDALAKTEIFMEMTMIDAAGKEFPVTQSVSMKYNSAEKVELPKLTEFK